MKKACVLGGDLRQFYLAEVLKQRGLSVAVFGVPQMENTHERMEDAVYGAEILALPIPVLPDGKFRIFPEDWADIGSITRFVGKNCSIFVGGNISLPSFNYLQDEAFLQQNAAITAEGAVSQMMQSTSCTVAGSRVLIVGFGRIGKALAEKLSLLGCKVFVSARSERDISQIIADGYRALITRQYGDLARFDCVFNTVPAAVFTELQTAAIPCPYIELASGNGGLPADAPKPPQYISARGLPGKYAPQAAAQAMLSLMLRKNAL